MYNSPRQRNPPKGHVAALKKLFESESESSLARSQSTKNLSKSFESLDDTRVKTPKMMLEMDLEVPTRKIDNLEKERIEDIPKATESKHNELESFMENMTYLQPHPGPLTVPKSKNNELESYMESLIESKPKPVPAPRRNPSIHTSLTQKSEPPFQEAKQCSGSKGENVAETNEKMDQMEVDGYFRASIASSSFCTDSDESDDELTFLKTVGKVLGDGYTNFLKIPESPSTDVPEGGLNINSGTRKDRNEYYEPLCRQNSSNTRRTHQFNTSRAILSIIELLKTTEKRHLQELTGIIPVFLYAAKNHALKEVKSAAGALTDTLQALLRLQKEFECSLAYCQSVDVIIKAFMDHEELFHVYKKFFMGNHCSLTFTLSDPKTDFKKEITLGALLNQRLFHYKMMLEEIHDELINYRDFLPLIRYPLNLMSDILNMCNVKNVLDGIVTVPVIQNSTPKSLEMTPLEVESCPFEVYGNYFLKNRFKVRKPFKNVLTVYLFSNIVLLTREEKKEIFYYQGHIRMDEILLMPPDEKKKKILKFFHYDKSKRYHKPVIYKFEALSKEVQVIWRDKIQEILGEQHEEMRRKAYQEHFTRESKCTDV